MLRYLKLVNTTGIVAETSNLKVSEKMQFRFLSTRVSIMFQLCLFSVNPVLAFSV